MRRLARAMIVAVTALVALVPAASGAEGGWHSDQPVASGIEVPVPLGRIGDIAFWQPNRGVLITAGNKAEPAGIYAYDGTGWHLYSTVCGGVEGRIAWAGPDDFWTVSSYATGQEGARGSYDEAGRTLCHFQNGAVVASYAKPFAGGLAYEMFGAACAVGGSGDCVFGGKKLEGGAPNSGPFHLRWDGTAISTVPSLTEPQPEIANPPGNAIGDVYYAGSFIESADEAPFLRRIDFSQPNPISPVELPAGAEGPYSIATDGAQLWAIAASGESALLSVAGGEPTSVALERPLEAVLDDAVEPGEPGAWVSGGSGDYATVTHVSSDGTVWPTIELPGPEEELNTEGAGHSIACPAPGQCWLATERGWLFHLGGSLEPDTDPAMHVLITARPADESTRSFVGAGIPPDDSGEVEAKRGAGVEELREPLPTRRRKAPPLVVNVRQKLVDKTLLELSFELRSRAHVQLKAERHGKVVAKTKRLMLLSGRHKLSLRLDPDHWPTKLDFEVHPVPASKKEKSG